MKFRTVADTTEIPGSECNRCGAVLLYITYNDGFEKTVCSFSENHDGDICQRVGHAEGWATTDRCDICYAPVQWVRVEVREGKAYTYMAFEDPPLEPGETVVLPSNQVREGAFQGKVLRLLDGPDTHHGYQGPYKAVVRRAVTCPTCGLTDKHDEECDLRKVPASVLWRLT
jgi:hypothetical protein